MKDRWKQPDQPGKINRNRDRNAVRITTKEGATATPIIQEDKRPDLVNRLFCKTVTDKKPLDKISNGFFLQVIRNPEPEILNPKLLNPSVSVQFKKVFLFCLSRDWNKFCFPETAKRFQIHYGRISRP